MKQISFILLSVCMLMIIPAEAFIRGRSFFYPRSQSVHAERELVGWEQDINLCDVGKCYGSFYVMPICSRSIRPCEIAEYLFGQSSVVFSGSHAPNRGEDDTLADYFGVPIDFVSTVHFKPRIENVIIDTNLYVGLDSWHPGLYARFHAPFGTTKWNLNMCEQVQNSGELNDPPGYRASTELTRAELSHNITDWFRGIKSVGDIQPIQYGRIVGPVHKSGISDVQVAFGWNMLCTEDYHFGFNLRTSIPTGNRSLACYLFEPILGNGGHWELGVGFTGHGFLWENMAHSFFVYGDMNITHLFAARERRSFDLKHNGTGSRYILLEEIGTPVVQGLMIDDILAQQQYHGKLIPAINKTTLDAEISVAVQMDMVIKFSYMYFSFFSLDIGYDLWARTAERVGCRQTFPENCYAVKGDALVYGFNEADSTRFAALNATQHDATMHAGQGSGNGNFSNSNADNAALATFDFGNGEDNLTLFESLTQVSGSNQAVLLTDCDIDTLSAVSPAAFSHTFFMHASYAWEDVMYILPYFGLGGEITVRGGPGRRTAALSEWGAWIKGGFAF